MSFLLSVSLEAIWKKK